MQRAYNSSKVNMLSAHYSLVLVVIHMVSSIATILRYTITYAYAICHVKAHVSEHVSEHLSVHVSTSTLTFFAVCKRPLLNHAPHHSAFEELDFYRY
jgi:hypothetical protein